MAAPQKLFIDSSFFLAFIDRANQNHIKTVGIFDILEKNHYKLYTSMLVVITTFGRLERDLGGVIAVEFLQVMLESSISVLYPTKQEMVHAYRFFKNNSSSQISMLEVINSKLMDKTGINQIATYDLWRNTMGTTISPLTLS